jgi:anti-sigma B factor antagonist
MPQPIGCQDTDQLACLDVRSFPDTACSCVRLRGELDLATASHLEQRLDRLRRDGHRQLILDMSGLEFLSAAGLTVLLRADQALRALGGRLILTGPTRIARRVLTITELDATLDIQPIPPKSISMVEQVDLDKVG